MSLSVQNLPTFNEIKYQTKDGENVIATKNNGVVTLVGDKNGVRQMPLEQFIQELPNNLPSMERTPEQDQVSFKAKTVSEPPAKHVQEYKVSASKSKKFWVGFSSLLPGLGQVINGDYGRGVLHFLAAAALVKGALPLSILALATKKPLGIAALVATSGALLVNSISSIVNAAKNATTKVRVEKELP